MGDRANVAILTEQYQEPVIFYTHGKGHELPDAVESAIAKSQPRWGDDAYASRIILHNVMTDLADPGSETGAGITVGILTDNEYPVLVVDVPRQRVRCVSEGDARARKWGAADDGLSFTEAKAGALRRLRGE